MKASLEIPSTLKTQNSTTTEKKKRVNTTTVQNFEKFLFRLFLSFKTPKPPLSH